MEGSEWTGLERAGEGDAERSVPGNVADAMEAAGRKASEERHPSSVEGLGLGDVLTPLQRLGDDDAVTTALDSLRAPLPDPSDLLPRGGAARAAARLVSLTISGGTDFVFPSQYDWSWGWGPVDHVADVAAGYFRTVGSAGNVDGDPGPSRHGATGIGIRLRSPGSDARVQVRPFVQYDFDWHMSANGGSASGSGGLDLSGWHGNDLVTDVVWYRLWSDSVSWGRTDGASDAGTAWPPDYVINMDMRADEWYVVNVGAWVNCDASGPPFINGATYGIVNAHLRWLVVERL